MFNVISQNLAYVLFETGDTEQAVEVLRAADFGPEKALNERDRRLLNAQSAARRDLALIFSQVGRFDEAREIFNLSLLKSDSDFFQRSISLDQASVAYLEALASGERRPKGQSIELLGEAEKTILAEAEPKRIRQILDRDLLLGKIWNHLWELTQDESVRQRSKKVLLSTLEAARWRGLKIVEVEALLNYAKIEQNTAMADVALTLMGPGWRRLNHIYYGIRAAIAESQGERTAAGESWLRISGSPYVEARQFRPL